MENTADALFDAFVEVLAQRVADKLGGAGAGAAGKELYTVEDLAERFSLSKSAVRQRVQAGEFGEVVQMGKRCYRVTAAGVRQYEREHMMPAHTARTGRCTETVRPTRRAKRDPGPI